MFSWFIVYLSAVAEVIRTSL